MISDKPASFEKREKEEEDRECGISVNGALMTFPEEDEER